MNYLRCLGQPTDTYSLQGLPKRTIRLLANHTRHVDWAPLDTLVIAWALNIMVAASQATRPRLVTLASFLFAYRASSPALARPASRSRILTAGLARQLLRAL
jgi:hypothetical protein